MPARLGTVESGSVDRQPVLESCRGVLAQHGYQTRVCTAWHGSVERGSVNATVLQTVPWATLRMHRFAEALTVEEESSACYSSPLSHDHHPPPTTQAVHPSQCLSTPFGAQVSTLMYVWGPSLVLFMISELLKEAEASERNIACTAYIHHHIHIKFTRRYYKRVSGSTCISKTPSSNGIGPHRYQQCKRGFTGAVLKGMPCWRSCEWQCQRSVCL